MKYLVKDHVLGAYTWRGTAEKKALVSLNELIFQSVRNSFKNYKMNDYKDYMVQWLKHSGTRQRVVTYTYPNRKEPKLVNSNYDNDVYEDDDDDY